jgi:hypothetical protein
MGGSSYGGKACTAEYRGENEVRGLLLLTADKSRQAVPHAKSTPTLRRWRGVDFALALN